MRYLGNKSLITPEISKLLSEKDLLNKNLKLFDAFCGTGAVADSLKDSCELIVNDLLHWCVIYSRGKISSEKCKFKKLGFDPFDFFNSNNKKTKGFFYKNYSPGGSKRMYFSAENAGRIDYIRSTIEKWNTDKLLTQNEYAYLLACLIESVSFVSNTAGVYGAFLKHWDGRAKKPLLFRKVESKESSTAKVKFLNQKIEDIIEKVDCDILYLDPPYTQNQYGTQYHLLETLILNDTPSISEITGSRPTGPMRSDWSKKYKSHILLDKIIAKTKAKYVLLSYSVDGDMSKSFIEACLKRYGKADTYQCKKISYKKYQNFKNRKSAGHFEYLFFIEKKPAEEVLYESPLNYIGSKARMIPAIKNEIPKDLHTFVDAFGGGFNVGININAKKIIYNDNNHLVKELVQSFHDTDTYQYILYLKRVIKKFDLEPAGAQSYQAVRKYYNSLPAEKKDPRLLYAVILYGFNQQIRFNSNYDFNNPVGMRWFNDKVLEKLVSFSRAIKEKNVSFESKDYSELAACKSPKSFLYLDPPYRLTTGAYNDGKRGFHGWNLATEKKLFTFLDDLNSKGINFLMSYVIKHKNKINTEIYHWLKRSRYNLTCLERSPGVRRDEVLISNLYKNKTKSNFGRKHTPKKNSTKLHQMTLGI